MSRKKRHRNRGNYKRIAGKSRKRRTIFRRWKDENGILRCWYCGKIMKRDEMTLEHVVPQHFNGPGHSINLVPCCLQCNCTHENPLDMENAPTKFKAMCVISDYVNIIVNKKPQGNSEIQNKYLGNIWDSAIDKLLGCVGNFPS